MAKEYDKYYGQIKINLNSYNYKHEIRLPRWINRNLDSAISKVTGFKLEHRGSVPDRGGFFFSPQHVDRLWGPSSPKQ